MKKQISKEIGDLGEQAALRILKHKGHEILHTKWRERHLEVDIISSVQNSVVFTEVKTRSNLHFGTPDSFVSKKKQSHLIKCANAWCYKENYFGELRFDIISIYINKQHKIISCEHLEDAYYHYNY